MTERKQTVVSKEEQGKKQRAVLKVLFNNTTYLILFKFTVYFNSLKWTDLGSKKMKFSHSVYSNEKNQGKSHIKMLSTYKTRSTSDNSTLLTPNKVIEFMLSKLLDLKN